MSKFNIGDKVQLKQLDKQGTIVDKMYSEAYSRYFYEVEYDGTSNIFQDDEMEVEDQIQNYRYTIEMHDGVVIAVLYETVGVTEREVGRGHGHVMHEGVLGFSQAASYALKKIYTDLAGGKMLRYNAEENRYE